MLAEERLVTQLLVPTPLWELTIFAPKKYPNAEFMKSKNSGEIGGEPGLLKDLYIAIK